MERRPGLPSSRAVVGALLVTVAAVGVFLAHAEAGRSGTASYAVAAVDLRPGEEVGAHHLEMVAAELPGSVAARAFSDESDLLGRVVVGPVAQGEVIQAGALTRDRRMAAGHEVALVVPRNHVASSQLQSGDRVDVYATTSDTTELVVSGASLVAAGGLRGGAIGEEREVEVVVSVPSAAVVADLVHALRTADVTVVRSTLAERDGPDGSVAAVTGGR